MTRPAGQPCGPPPAIGAGAPPPHRRKKKTTLTRLDGSDEPVGWWPPHAGGGPVHPRGPPPSPPWTAIGSSLGGRARPPWHRHWTAGESASRTRLQSSPPDDGSVGLPSSCSLLLRPLVLHTLLHRAKHSNCCPLAVSKWSPCFVCPGASILLKKCTLCGSFTRIPAPSEQRANIGVHFTKMEFNLFTFDCSCTELCFYRILSRMRPHLFVHRPLSSRPRAR